MDIHLKLVKHLNLIIVTLDDNDIYENHKYLYEKYFKKYKKYIIVDKDNFTVDSSLINKKVYIKNTFSYLLSEDEVDDISTLVHITDSDNNKVGEIIIKLKNKEIGNIDIYSYKNKKENNSILSRFKNLFIR